MISQVPKASSFKKSVIETMNDIQSNMFYGKLSNEKTKEYLLAEKVVSYICYRTQCIEDGVEEENLMDYLGRLA